ncbi:MAG: hypothetical protein JRI72_00180 [Deltaproteobacteria bacterium]|nr:hypothetical protein [Deltaproteobacteria bacterium]
MGKHKNLTGLKFNRLLVLKQAKSKNNKRRWLCKCDCGKLVEVITYDLTRGHTKSCGCLNKEKIRKVGKSNTTHNMKKTRQYNTWSHMKSRCTNLKNKNYSKYGGRGITISKKWLTFEGFWDDMKKGYNDNLTLERIDNNKGYCKENCKWATMKIQQNNKRNNRKITYKGQTRGVYEWAEIINISPQLLHWRLKNKWPLEKALNKSSGYKKE